VKDKRYDSFADNSGLRIGEFKLTALICMYVFIYVCHVFWCKKDVQCPLMSARADIQADNQAVVHKEAIRLVCMYVCICGSTDKFEECCSVDEDRDSIKNNNFDICRVRTLLAYVWLYVCMHKLYTRYSDL
jgi:hypothetical protein